MKKRTSLHEGAKAREEKRKVDLSGHKTQWGHLVLSHVPVGTPACACSAGAEPDRAWSYSRADLHMANSSFVT